MIISKLTNDAFFSKLIYIFRLPPLFFNYADLCYFSKFKVITKSLILNNKNSPLKRDIVNMNKHLDYALLERSPQGIYQWMER